LIRAYLAQGQLSAAASQAERLAKIAEPTPELRRSVAVVVELVKRRNDVLKAAKIPAGKAEAWKTAADAVVSAEHAHAEGRPAADVEGLLAPAFRDGVELAPAAALRGLLALEKGRLLRASTDADRALTLNPNDGQGLYLRGRVRLERGEAAALADLVKAVELNGRKDPILLHWLAAAQYRGGKKADALATQREAVKLKPKDRDLAEQLEEFEKDGKSGNSGE
jgi:tetratricopeptide (TPR) repeat protein